MQSNNDEWKQKYETLLQTKIERLTSLSPDAVTELRKQCAALVADIQESLGEDPMSPGLCEECPVRSPLNQGVSASSSFERPQSVRRAKAYGEQRIVFEHHRDPGCRVQPEGRRAVSKP
jgi:hypothetical protein